MASKKIPPAFCCFHCLAGNVTLFYANPSFKKRAILARAVRLLINPKNFVANDVGPRPVENDVLSHSWTQDGPVYKFLGGQKGCPRRVQSALFDRKKEGVSGKTCRCFCPDPIGHQNVVGSFIRHLSQNVVDTTRARKIHSSRCVKLQWTREKTMNFPSSASIIELLAFCHRGGPPRQSYSTRRKPAAAAVERESIC